MIILTIRTDKPVAEIGLYRGNDRLEYHTWEAHRQLSETIHKKIDMVLEAQPISLVNIEGIIFYEGSGSFTGLRIGASVANALGYSCTAPIVSMGGQDWINQGIQALHSGVSASAVPKYSEPPRVTQPKK